MADLKTLVNDMSGAAAALLDDLSLEQRDKINLPFEDETARRLWYYTPTPRPGLPLGEMNAVQQQAVRRLMGIGLSTPGYNFAATVMGLEYMVDQWSGFPTRTYGEMPGTVVRDPNNYCVAIFGSPDSEAGWGWRIGGHHLNLHYTLVNGFVSPTPAFFGAEPSHVAMPGGATLRALAAEEDLARELVSSLSPEQRSDAVISPIAATDVVQTNRPRVEEGALYQIGGGGPGGQGLREKLGLTPELDERLRYTTTPKGIAGASLQDNQRELLSRLVAVYLEHVAEPIQAQYASLLDPERIRTSHFAWAGALEYGEPHYYRIQGDRLLIEYDCTQNDANHTHSVWRDPQGDFGEDVLAQHYAAQH